MVASILLCAVACIGIAQVSGPSITSAAVVGNQILIKGSAFGIGPDSVESTRDNIDRGDVGSPFSRDKWSTDANAGSRIPAVYSTDKRHSGSKSLKIALKYYSGVQKKGSDLMYDHGSFFRKCYMSYWVRREDFGTPVYRQWKVFRFRGTSTVYDSSPEIYNNNSYNADGSCYARYFTVGTNGVLGHTESPVNPNANLYNVSNAFLGLGHWYRVETYVEQSDLDTANGSWQYWIHRPDEGIVAAIRDYWRNIVTIASGAATAGWRYLHYQNYFATIPDDATLPSDYEWDVYMDDMYLQFGSMARVELGNAATWSDCTYREIQEPVTGNWSAGSIVANFKPGAITGDKWVYVVDDLGNHNQVGYSLKEPTAPRNLRASPQK